MRDSIMTFYEQLAGLLQRFGITPNAPAQWEDVTNRHENSVYTPGQAVWSRRISLPVADIVAFQERVGVCYCAHKQQRLTVAAAFYRYKACSHRQATGVGSNALKKMVRRLVRERESARERRDQCELTGNAGLQQAA